MAKLFLIMAEDVNSNEFNENDLNSYDECMMLEDNTVYIEMVKWLIDNDINFYSDITNDRVGFIFKDEDAVAVKLRWV